MDSQRIKPAENVVISDEAPRFVKLRGCINCDVVKRNKEKHGSDYGGFDHELIIGCVIFGCHDRGHAYTMPFYDPEELIRLAKSNKNYERTKEKIKKYCLDVKERFGEFYEEMGISIDSLIEGL